MNRTAVFSLSACALLLPCAAGAQTADPHTYSDAAMTYTAPADYTPIPVPSVSPDNLDHPTVVAAFAKNPRRPDATLITLTIENDTDNLDAFEADSESRVRNQGSDSVFVRKELTTLKNGMPAYFLTITVSAEAAEQKMYEYVWVDHVRGVTLAVSGRYGSIDDQSAKKVLGDVTAVAYPRNQF